MENKQLQTFLYNLSKMSKQFDIEFVTVNEKTFIHLQKNTNLTEMDLEKKQTYFMGVPISIDNQIPIGKMEVRI